MNEEVERFEGELRGLRTRVETLEAENYQLRARVANCTCAGAAEISPPAPPSNEQQEDLFARLGCLDCD